MNNYAMFLLLFCASAPLLATNDTFAWAKPFMTKEGWAKEDKQKMEKGEEQGKEEEQLLVGCVLGKCH